MLLIKHNFLKSLYFMPLVNLIKPLKDYTSKFFHQLCSKLTNMNIQSGLINHCQQQQKLEICAVCNPFDKSMAAKYFLQRSWQINTYEHHGWVQDK